jgi:hypothetical protein
MPAWQNGWILGALNCDLDGSRIPLTEEECAAIVRRHYQEENIT